jgi:hypothetical protein
MTTINGQQCTLPKFSVEFGRELKGNEDTFLSDRIHNPLQYSYFWEDNKLADMILRYLSKYWSIRQKIVELLEEDWEEYDQYEDKWLQFAYTIDYLDALLVIFLLNLVQNSSKVKIERCDVIDLYLKHNKCEEEFNLEGVCDYIWEIFFEEFATNIEPKIKQIKEEVKIWTSGVFCVMKWVDKWTFNIERSLDFIDGDDNRQHRREFLLNCARLSSWFSLLVWAACDDPNDVFYQKEITRDVEILCNSLEIIEVDDLSEHLLNMHHGMDYIRYIYSVVPKGMCYESKILQNLAMLSWGAIYKIWTEESLLEGDLVAHCISHKLQKQVTLFCQQNEVRKQLIEIPGTVELNKEIYFEKSLEDELTIENIGNFSSYLNN